MSGNSSFCCKEDNKISIIKSNKSDVDKKTRERLLNLADRKVICDDRSGIWDGLLETKAIKILNSTDSVPDGLTPFNTPHIPSSLRQFLSSNMKDRKLQICRKSNVPQSSNRINEDDLTKTPTFIGIRSAKVLIRFVCLCFTGLFSFFRMSTKTVVDHLIPFYIFEDVPWFQKVYAMCLNLISIFICFPVLLIVFPIIMALLVCTSPLWISSCTLVFIQFAFTQIFGGKALVRLN